MVGRNYTSDLPPGFRFHPTDEELIMCYLRNQAPSKPCHVSIIPEVDIYKFDPWELPEKALFGENEWYFFSPQDRKYPNGVRLNRAAVSGYWKATGTDKAIYSESKYVGVKKALVFYKGKPPKGIKTDWIMHEYRLNESRSQSNKQNGCMRLDDLVLCRIYKKKNIGRGLEQRGEHSCPQTVPATTEQQSRTCSHNHIWEFDCMGSAYQLLNDNSSNVPFNNQEIISNNPSFSIGTDQKLDWFQQVQLLQQQQQQQQHPDAMKFQVNQTFFENPNYELQ